MRFEKILAGLILLPIILIVLLIFLPLILIYGAIMLLLHKPVHYTFRKTTTTVRKTPSGEDEVIDVEVIRTETSGEKNDISGRTLNQ